MVFRLMASVDALEQKPFGEFTLDIYLSNYSQIIDKIDLANQPKLLMPISTITGAQQKLNGNKFRNWKWIGSNVLANWFRGIAFVAIITLRWSYHYSIPASKATLNSIQKFGRVFTKIRSIFFKRLNFHVFFFRKMFSSIGIIYFSFSLYIKVLF